MDPVSQVTVEQLVTRYLEWVQKRRAVNTFLLYSSRLKPFVAKFGTQLFETLSPLDIDDYLFDVNHRPDGSEKAPDTIRANVIALQQLQEFATNKLEIPKRVIKDLEKPVGRYRDRLPTDAEASKLLAASSPAFALIYRALRQSGARPNELARATLADWKRTDNVIILEKHKTGKKTGRSRRIAVGEKLCSILLESVGNRTEGPIFLSPRGRAWNSKRLSQTFAETRERAGIPITERLVLYSSRHEHATQISATLGLQAAADALDHANLQTTRRYDHKTPKQLRSNQDVVNFET